MQVQSTALSFIRRDIGGTGEEGLVSAVRKRAPKQTRLAQATRDHMRISSEGCDGQGRHLCAPALWSNPHRHRSHFGSRYKLGCCGHAGLFVRGFEPWHVPMPQMHVCDPCKSNTFIADGHTASNAPDLFRPPKLSGAGPG